MDSPPLIVVCMKPVWRGGVPVRLHGEGRLHPDDLVSGPNPADLGALGLALRLAEQLKQEAPTSTPRILALGMGAEARCLPILRRALALGATHARHFTMDAEPPPGLGLASHTWRVTRALAGWLHTQQPALVLAGERGGDGGTGSFAALLQGALNAGDAQRQTALAHKVVEAVPTGPDPTLGGAENGLRVVSRLERGYGQAMVLPFPAVLSVSAQVAPPAEPGLAQWLAAQQAEIETGVLKLPPAPFAEEGHLRQPRPRVGAYSLPAPSENAEGRIAAMVRMESGGGGRVLNGEPGQMADELAGFLRERGYLQGV